jgi:hypothetical protein
MDQTAEPTTEETTDATISDAGAGEATAGGDAGLSGDGNADAVAEVAANDDSADSSTESARAPSSASEPAADVQRTADPAGPIDLDAKLDALDALNDKLERGDLSYEEHAKQSAKLNREITKATREVVKPAQEIAQRAKEADEARKYWTNWGKGDDPANLIGKTVNSARAQQLFEQSYRSVANSPRYKGRKGIDVNAIAYDKFLDALEAEKKNPAKTVVKPTSTATRVSGGTESNNRTPTRERSAKEKLDAGEYNINVGAFVGE